MTGDADISEGKVGGEGSWLAHAVANSPAIHYVAQIAGKIENDITITTELCFISENVDMITYQALGDRWDGETIGEF